MRIDSRRRGCTALAVALGLLGIGILLPASASASKSRKPAGIEKKHASKKSRAISKKKTTATHSSQVAPRPKPEVSFMAPSANPSAFVIERVRQVLSELKSRPIRPAGMPSTFTSVDSGLKKRDWLASLYSRNMVEASLATEMLSDKLVMARVLEAELGSRAFVYIPKTLGLKEFLYKYNLVDLKGDVVASGDRIEAALFEEFPSGFAVRPAVGVAPRETARGLYPDTDKFVVELLKKDSVLYRPEHLTAPVRSHILEAIASGEAIVLQEDVVGTADARRKLAARVFQEVRIHTFEGRVVQGAVPARWVQSNRLSDDQALKAEAFVADFLKSLPMSILTRQAWGVDVAVLDNGEMRITDVVTNRGKPIQWSSYLEQPRVIGAYARHFETYYGFRFQGISGSLIRHNFANYFPYWEKRIEKAKPGLTKMLAYLPPIP